MKLRYMRIHLWVFIGVFLISVGLFYGTLDNHVLVNEFHTVRSVDATLPVISFETSGVELNRTLGYTFIPQEGKMRESITPVSPTNRTFTVLVDEKDSNGNTQYSDIAHAVTKEVREAINKQVLDAYNQALEESQNDSFTEIEDDDLPFDEDEDGSMGFAPSM